MNFLTPQKLRIGLKAYKSDLLDDSCKQIIEALNSNETQAVGPSLYQLNVVFIVF